MIATTSTVTSSSFSPATNKSRLIPRFNTYPRQLLSRRHFSATLVSFPPELGISVTVLGLRHQKFFGRDSTEEGLRLFDQLRERHKKPHFLLGLEKWELQSYNEESKVGEVRHRRAVQHLREFATKRKIKKPEFLPLYQVSLLEKYPTTPLDFEEHMFYDSLARASFQYPVEAVYWLFWEKLLRSTSWFQKNESFRAFMRRRVPGLAGVYFEERAHYMAAKIYLYACEEANDDVVVYELPGGVRQFDDVFRWTDGAFYVRRRGKYCGYRLVRVSARNTDTMLKSAERIRSWVDNHSTDGALDGVPEEVSCILRKDPDFEERNALWLQYDEYGRALDVAGGSGGGRKNRTAAAGGAEVAGENNGAGAADGGDVERKAEAAAAGVGDYTRKAAAEASVQPHMPLEDEDPPLGIEIANLRPSGYDPAQLPSNNKHHHVVFAAEEMFQPLVTEKLEKIDNIQTAYNILHFYEDRCYRQPPCLHFWWYGFIWLYIFLPIWTFGYVFCWKGGFRLWYDFFSYRLIDSFSRN